jgi:hypothetical protein
MDEDKVNADLSPTPLGNQLELDVERLYIKLAQNNGSKGLQVETRSRVQARPRLFKRCNYIPVSIALNR